ncbi:hypothetical protein GOBAR_DD18887 [Gossypium barbadense]|nr:hypothetical protein GOBAR_DD18887 [Gossypium barbadense]
MALARVARNGLRRSGGVGGGNTTERNIFFERLSGSLEKINVHSNLTSLSTIKGLNHMNFWSRGIRTTPPYQFPLAERLVETESESEHDEPRYPGLEATKPGEKPRVVVLGTGWAACRFLNRLDTKAYDVVCISPRNHMVFTPLLASTCVGTLEFRSVSEPVSRIQSALATSPNSYFYLASCIGVDANKHEVYCETMSNGGLPHEPYQFKVAYDKLVIAAGAEPLTFGIKGVKENAYFLREVNHAQEIRKKLLLNLMLSENPGISEEEKSRLLHCVIIGGGPTGVEFSVWSTGVGPSQFIKSLNLPKSPGGRIGIDEWLRVPSVEDIFALGDCAGFLEQTGKPVLPALAQVAERQGKYLVEVFNRMAKEDGGKAFSAKDMSLGDPFVYKHLGSMASVGRYKALVDLRQSKDAQGISLAGFISWLIWRSAYLTRVVSWRNRFYVAVNWATTLVFGRDDSRIG